MAIKVQRIALTHKKLPFVGCPVLGILYELISVLGPFSVIVQKFNFLKEKSGVCIIVDYSRDYTVVTGV